MTGGTIKNFYGVYGGAVSLEYGTFLIEGGTIFKTAMPETAERSLLIMARTPC